MAHHVNLTDKWDGRGVRTTFSRAPRVGLRCGKCRKHVATVQIYASGRVTIDESIKAPGSLIYTAAGAVLKCGRPSCPMVWRRTVEEFKELVSNAARAGDRWVMLLY